MRPDFSCLMPCELITLKAAKIGCFQNFTGMRYHWNLPRDKFAGSTKQLFTILLVYLPSHSQDFWLESWPLYASISSLKYSEVPKNFARAHTSERFGRRCLKFRRECKGCPLFDKNPDTRVHLESDLDGQTVPHFLLD